jgi:hypothetical protein
LRLQQVEKKSRLTAEESRTKTSVALDFHVLEEFRLFRGTRIIEHPRTGSMIIDMEDKVALIVSSAMQLLESESDGNSDDEAFILAALHENRELR